MAFQTGTQVRPELGRADVSGFAKGGAAIGAGILQGIENYREQKQITASALADLEGRFAADPGLLETASQAGGNIGKSFKKVFEEGDFNQRDVLNLSGYVNSLQSTQAAAQQSRLREAQIAAAGTPKLSAFEEKRRALIRAGYSDKEATERAATGQRIQVGPAGEPSIDPTLLKQQIDADVNVLNEEIIPSINAAPFVNKMEELLNKEGIEGVITGKLAKPELFLKSIGADLGL